MTVCGQRDKAQEAQERANEQLSEVTEERDTAQVELVRLELRLSQVFAKIGEAGAIAVEGD